MIFDLFTTTNYTFLQLDGRMGGNKVVAETVANGIVKIREGMIQTDNMEQREASSTIHIRPSEPFLATLDGNLVGHGVRVTKNGLEATYRIQGQVEGFDFDLGKLEFYVVTLKKESLWETSDLPLE